MDLENEVGGGGIQHGQLVLINRNLFGPVEYFRAFRKNEFCELNNCCSQRIMNNLLVGLNNKVCFFPDGPTMDVSQEACD